MPFVSYTSDDETSLQNGLDLKAFRLFRKRLWPYIARYKKLFWSSLTLILLSTATQLSIPWLLGLTVDRVLIAKQNTLIVPFTLCFLFADISYAVLMLIHTRILTILGQKVLHDLRQDLLLRYQLYPVSEFNRTPTGKLVTRLVNDTSSLQDLFTSGIALAFGNVAIVLGIVIWLIILHPRLGLVCVSVFPLMALSAWFFGKLLRERFRVSRSALSQLNAFLAENISGMWLIQIFNKQDLFKKRFIEVSGHYTKSLIRAVRVFAYFQPIITVLSTLSLAILVFYGGFLVTEQVSFLKPHGLSLGLLVAFMAYLQALYAPIRDITEKYNLFLSAISSCERIFEFIDKPVENTELTSLANTLHSHERLAGNIDFQNVHFQYFSGNWTLKDLTFSIKSGEKVGIVGHTGAGKTTLSTLLLRFYEIQAGSILVDGNDIREIEKRDLRRQVAYIQQEPFLFSGTIEDNLLLWQKNRKQSFLELPAFAREPFENGQLPLQREVYEKGTNLSAGERQIISFIRALVQNPSILILDEATAHIDSLTEQWIEKVSDFLFKDRTVLIIAHRLATLKRVNQIIVLDHGTLAEKGSHDQLLQSRGLYYDFVSRL